MTSEIAIVLAILVISLVLFNSEVIRMDLVALLVLGTREVPMIVVIMITTAALSAFMNNIGVAALMLPVFIDIARRTQIPASRLLMPLAYATLLGGLTTRRQNDCRKPDRQVHRPLHTFTAARQSQRNPARQADRPARRRRAAGAGTRGPVPRAAPLVRAGHRTEAPVLKSIVAAKVSYAEVTINEGFPVVSELIRHAAFRTRFDVAVVGIRRKWDTGSRTWPTPLQAGDRVLVQGEVQAIRQLERSPDFSNVQALDAEQLVDRYHADERMFVVRLSKSSDLGGSTLANSLLADAFDFRVLAIFRDGRLTVMPRGDNVLKGGDLLLI